MPSYHDPYGDFDHLKPIPLPKAQQQLWDHQKKMAEFALERHIQMQQHAGNQEVKEAMLKKYRELDFVLAISARQM